jgi:putative nucleotidyltransferase with HDIG domain
MKAATSALLVRKVNNLSNLPAVPSILKSLGETLSASPSDVNVPRIVDLISYDKSLAAQCLRMAKSAFFSRRAEITSLKAAVLSLGLKRIRDIVYSCSLPTLFGGAKKGMARDTFWRHALGTALVSQQLAQRLGVQDVEKLYLAGLLHDIGILVNALLFEEQFHQVLEAAAAEETPLCEVEKHELGFSHCESGRLLADAWKLPEDISEVIEHHHEPSPDDPACEMTSLVHLADLLCRVRGLGYGYYEARGLDLTSEVAWNILQQKYPVAAGLDLARFTLELDGCAAEVQSMVDSIFGAGNTP